MPHMLDDDYTPHSALDIFVKDLVNSCTSIFVCNQDIFFHPILDASLVHACFHELLSGS